MVNIDGHKFDIFAKDADGKVFRPLMVGIQDIYSRKILAWRIGGSESAIQTRLTFADLFRDYGIPKACVFDNGRAFASKLITGGAKSRFRFKIRAEDRQLFGRMQGASVFTEMRCESRGLRRQCDRNGAQ